MSIESLGTSWSSQGGRNPDARHLTPTGQMIGWAVFGGLVVVGFAFGIVVGSDRPKTVIVTKPAREPEIQRPENVRPETTKPETAKHSPKTVAEVTAAPSVTQQETPKTPVATVPKADPKPPVSTTVVPPKIDPKPDPKPVMPVAKTTTPKPDKPPAKKDDFKAVSFKKEVTPILRTYCLDCHGGSKGKPRGDVDLTTVAKMMKSPGNIVVPGKPDQSDIYTSITEREMPGGGKPKPSKDELLVLKNWILGGAKE